MFNRWREIYAEFPRTFWILIGATFVDRLGAALLFPFFALYITDHFGVGMTEVGYLFALFSLASIFGSGVGGALTDRYGRRWVILFSLIISATSSVLMGLVNDIALFYLLAVFVGLLSNSGGPAQQAVVADLLPGEKQAEGFGILRVAANLAVALGPAIGGLLAVYSYLLLFILDAISSLITAVIVYRALPETKPQVQEGQPEAGLAQTFRGYGDVLRDRLFMLILGTFVLSGVVYSQMNSTLGVFMRDFRDIPPRGYGAILSLNAAMVVIFQFWITRRISKRPPLLTLVLGILFYAAGFAMYGFVTSFAMFAIAMIIITIGEMIVAPTSQSLAARLSPPDMRGRYMAIYGFGWTISFALGPLFGGLILDNADPNLVWYVSGVLCLMSAAGFAALHVQNGSRLEQPVDVAEPVAVT